MKATLAILAVVGLVAAQGINDQPQCAQSCLRESLPKADPSCKPDDTACACKKETQAKLTTLAAPCILKNCSKEDLAKAQSAGAAACAHAASSSHSGSSSATSSHSSSRHAATSSASDSDSTATGTSASATRTGSAASSSSSAAAAGGPIAGGAMAAVLAAVMAL